MTTHRLRSLPFAVLLLFLGVGCANHGPTDLTLSCARSGQCLIPSFPEAYSTRGAGGDADIVLVDDPTRQDSTGSRTGAPVRQVMHIRVLWKPTRDLKADHTSASNATIHWYVLGKTAGDIVEYDGTAMVVVEPDDTGTTLSIRSASLRAVACRGHLCDPIGPASLRGTVHTTDDPDRVRRVLSDLRATVIAAKNHPGNLTLRPHPESPSSFAQ